MSQAAQDIRNGSTPDANRVRLTNQLILEVTQMTSVAGESERALGSMCDPIKLASVHDSTWKALNFHLEYQEKTNWCWAALAVSVAKTYASSGKYSQCEIANGELGRTDCCKKDKDEPCNVFGYLMSSLNRLDRFEQWNVRRPEKSERLRLQVRYAIQAEARSEIDQGRPLCARIAWSGVARISLRSTAMLATLRWMQ
ncbi:hypothetical protein ACVMAJ_000103 [Bradyrhizobium sp. USDA 4448]